MFTIVFPILIALAVAGALYYLDQRGTRRLRPVPIRRDPRLRK